MATLSERFPMRVAFGFSGGARYSVGIAVTLGGREKRNQNWSMSRGRWVATQNAKKEVETQILVHYFHAAGGRENNFPFRDWIDFQVSSAQGVVELISGNDYQLQKRYTRGGVTRDRDIFRPVNASISGGGSYTVNTSTGVVTRNSGAAPTGWSGQFDCLCRFDTDDLQDIEVVGKGPDGEFIYTWGGIAIVETRLDE